MYSNVIVSAELMASKKSFPQCHVIPQHITNNLFIQTAYALILSSVSTCVTDPDDFGPDLGLTFEKKNQIRIRSLKKMLIQILILIYVKF
jgi:hypothetical protein